MEFNVKKFKLMHITKRKTPFHSDLHFNNKILKVTSEFRDLGLVTYCNLSLNVKVKKFNQARVNGGSNYDSLKVAKCLVL